MLISPSRAQEEETRARVTRAEQESLSLHVPREKKRGLVLYLWTLCFSFLRIARAMMQKGTARRLKGNDVYNLLFLIADFVRVVRGHTWRWRDTVAVLSLFVELFSSVYRARFFLSRKQPLDVRMRAYAWKHIRDGDDGRNPIYLSLVRWLNIFKLSRSFARFREFLCFFSLSSLFRSFGGVFRARERSRRRRIY